MSKPVFSDRFDLIARRNRRSYLLYPTQRQPVSLSFPR